MLKDLISMRVGILGNVENAIQNGINRNTQKIAVRKKVLNDN